MSDSYDDYEAKMQLAEHEWEMVKTEHDRAVELGKAYERGWNAALAQRKPLTDEEIILIVADCASSHQHTDIHFARAIERAHGIKELV